MAKNNAVVATPAAISSPQPLPPPVVLLNRLLLTETCSVTRVPPESSLAPDLLTIRATQVSVLLQDILEEKGYRHGGLNE